MLVLRDTQLEALRDRSARAFRDSAAAWLRREEADTTELLSARELDRLLAAGIAQARRHGVLLPADLRGYLRFVLRHGPAFDRELEWARRALSPMEASGSEKLARLRVMAPR